MKQKIIIVFACVLLTAIVFKCSKSSNPIADITKNEEYAIDRPSEYWYRADIIEQGQPALRNIATALAKIMSYPQILEKYKRAARNSSYLFGIVNFRKFIADEQIKSEIEAEMESPLMLKENLELLPPNLVLYVYYAQRELLSDAKKVLIAYPDSRIPEESIGKVPAFDAQGNAYFFDPDSVPEKVTLVLTVSENDSIYFPQTRTNTLSKEVEIQGVQACTHRKVSSEHIQVFNDHEPAYLEPPEFYIKMRMQQGWGGWKTTSITPPVNNTSPWTFHKLLYDMGCPSSWPSYIMMELYEDDSGSSDDLVGKKWTQNPPGGLSTTIPVNTSYWTTWYTQPSYDQPVEAKVTLRFYTQYF